MQFRKYDLTEKELRGLANLAKQEQGSIDGACAELSLMANLFEKQSTYKTLYEYARNSGWFARAAYFMDNGSANATYRQYADYVLRRGLRTLPPHIDEHDCLSDIRSISSGDVRDKSAYKRGQTVIKNAYGSTYTFYCFPAAGADPFGYTHPAGAYEGTLQELIDRETEMATIPYVETGTNHQVFSMIVNAAGLAGYQDNAWCCTYQFAMEILTFGLEKALKHWHMTKDTYCGYACFETYDRFYAVGKTGKVPELGALCVFTHSHVGRVLSIDSESKTFLCGEGNTSNAQYDRSGDSCAVKRYSWNDKRIKGFCYIDYASEMGGQENVDEQTVKASEPQYRIILHELKLGFRGPDVLLMEEILKARGYYKGSLDIDFGPLCKAALIKYQQDRINDGMHIGGADGKPDAVCGEGTWADMLGMTVEVIAA